MADRALVGALNRFPVGLLELVNSKVGGITPSLLSQVAAGEIGLEPFLEAGIGLRTVNGNVTIPTSATVSFGFPTETRVPEGEWWIPWAMSVRLIAGAGDSLTYPKLSIRNDALELMWVSPQYNLNLAASQGLFFGETFHRRILLPPGYQFGVLGGPAVNASAALNATVYVSYYPLTNV